MLLHIKSDAEDFLDPTRLEAIVRKWADHVTLPVTIARDGKDQPANEGTALWRKPKSEMTEQSLNAFYRHLGHIFDTPWTTLHWRAEGTLEFYALLFIPGSRPFNVLDEDRESHIRLHVRRMFITDKADLLPSWLRFVQGVVDTEDLPLNVSREMLQTTPVLARIRKAVTSRVLAELKSRSKETAEYDRFWENFGAVLKEGVWEDTEHRTELAALLRFRSSRQDGWTSLPDYINRMQPGQDTIYYLLGDDVEALKKSPQLEGFAAKGFEVLLLTDSIDPFWPDRLGTFEGKRLASITQATDDLHTPADMPDISVLTSALKSALGDQVSDVRPTARLTDSAVVLTSSGKGPDLHLQRMMRRAGRSGSGAPPVMEVNPKHPLIEALGPHAGDQSLIEQAAATLLDLARVQEGELPNDPAAFAKRVTGLMMGGLMPVQPHAS